MNRTRLRQAKTSVLQLTIEFDRNAEDERICGEMATMSAKSFKSGLDAVATATDEDRARKEALRQRELSDMRKMVEQSSILGTEAWNEFLRAVNAKEYNISKTQLAFFADSQIPREHRVVIFKALISNPRLAYEIQVMVPYRQIAAMEALVKKQPELPPDGSPPKSQNKHEKRRFREWWRALPLWRKFEWAVTKFIILWGGFRESEIVNWLISSLLGL